MGKGNGTEDFQCLEYSKWTTYTLLLIFLLPTALRISTVDRCCPFRWRLSPAHAANIRQIRHGPPLQKHPCIAAPTLRKFHPGLEKDSYIFKRPITENEASDSRNLSTKFEPYSSLNHVSYPKQSGFGVQFLAMTME